jgi:hypothetical protein
MNQRSPVAFNRRPVGPASSRRSLQRAQAGAIRLCHSPSRRCTVNAQFSDASFEQNVQDGISKHLSTVHLQLSFLCGGWTLSNWHNESGFPPGLPSGFRRPDPATRI